MTGTTSVRKYSVPVIWGRPRSALVRVPTAQGVGRLRAWWVLIVVIMISRWVGEIFGNWGGYNQWHRKRNSRYSVQSFAHLACQTTRLTTLSIALLTFYLIRT